MHGTVQSKHTKLHKNTHIVRERIYLPHIITTITSTIVSKKAVFLDIKSNSYRSFAEYVIADIIRIQYRK